MNHSIKAVIFDMGGVLLRTENPLPREMMAKRFSTTRRQLEEFVFHSPSSLQSEVGAVTEISHWRTVLTHFGHPYLDPIETYQEYFSGDAIDRDLISFIESLKPDYKVALLSNAWVNARNNLESAFHFLDTFDVSIFSAEVETRKPEEDIYRIMLKALSVEPSEAVFIDDFAENIDAAKKIGMKTIHFKNAQDTIRQVKGLLSRE